MTTTTVQLHHLGAIELHVPLDVESMLALARAAEREGRRAEQAADKAAAKGLSGQLVAANRRKADQWRHTAHHLHNIATGRLRREVPHPSGTMPEVVQHNDGDLRVVFVGGASVRTTGRQPEPGSWARYRGRELLVRSVRPWGAP